MAVGTQELQTHVKHVRASMDARQNTRRHTEVRHGHEYLLGRLNWYLILIGYKVTRIQYSIEPEAFYFPGNNS